MAQKATGMTTLSYQSTLVDHYRKVRARLYRGKRTVMAPTTPEPPKPAVASSVSLREAILTLNDLEIIDPVSLDAIMKAVIAATGVSAIDIRSVRRQENIVKARHLFFWLARKYTMKSFPQIGRSVNKDHSTCQNGCRVVSRNLSVWRIAIAKAEAALVVS